MEQDASRDRQDADRRGNGGLDRIANHCNVTFGLHAATTAECTAAKWLL